MTKRTVLMIALSCVGLGFMAGVVGTQAVEHPRLEVLVSGDHQLQLHYDIAVLKLLDEGRIDLAKSILETKAKTRLQFAPAELEGLRNSELKQRYTRTVDLGRRALADRSKSYEQLEKESRN